jgi:hypothetical protein
MNRLDYHRAFTAIVLVCAPAWAQEPASGTQAGTAATAGKEWSFYGSVFGYLIPEGRSYASPVLTADRRTLHLEARYNYENLETGSIWLGYNLSFGDKLTLDLTPMIGGVFGESNGVAPGYLASLSYRRLSLDTQGEYLFDTEDRSGSFFYNWSELSYSPAEWFRAGIVVQRTKAYQTELDVHRGVLAGFSYKRADFAAYVFNLGWTDPTVVLSIGIQF